MQRTALATAVIVSIVLLILGCLIVTSFGLPAAYPLRMHFTGAVAWDDMDTWQGITRGAALLFFAFAGYARIATMGEEVRKPERAIPSAIHQSIGLVALLYAVLTYLLLTRLGTEALAASDIPLAKLADVTRFDRVALLIVTLDSIETAMGFSAFGVLQYYSVTNLCALRQPTGERRYPRALHVLGLLACLGLVASLPPCSLATGLAIVLAGLIYRLVVVGLMAHRQRSDGETIEPRPGKDAEDA